jgi:hypothetical protein
VSVTRSPGEEGRSVDQPPSLLVPYRVKSGLFEPLPDLGGTQTRHLRGHGDCDPLRGLGVTHRVTLLLRSQCTSRRDLAVSHGFDDGTG